MKRAAFLRTAGSCLERQPAVSPVLHGNRRWSGRGWKEKQKKFLPTS